MAYEDCRTELPDESIVKNIRSCARCGNDHYSILFHPMKRPVLVGIDMWTHWGSCPVTGDPILLRIVAETTDEEA